MRRRVTRIQIWVGSTVEELSETVNSWLVSTNLCPGNVLSFRLTKLGNVYQGTLLYAQVISEGDIDSQAL